MARFEGTVAEYVRLVGPRIRNVIQVKTKPLKRALDHVCQKCGQRRELEAIHAPGNERIQIIRRLLYSKADSTGIVRVDDMRVLEEDIVSENIRHIQGFWCHDCHAKEDPKVGKYGSKMPMPGVSD